MTPPPAWAEGGGESLDWTLASGAVAPDADHDAEVRGVDDAVGVAIPDARPSSIGRGWMRVRIGDAVVSVVGRVPNVFSGAHAW